jgi:rubrerythrin
MTITTTPASQAPTEQSYEYSEFMSRAYAIELEAAERYAQFADQLDEHNNREVAALFRKLAGFEALHAERILQEMGWPSVPPLTPAYAWEPNEAPETAPFDSLHYLMQPWHALEIALRCELQAQKYFEAIAAGNAPPSVRQAASELAREEAEHAALIREWMSKVPRPAEGWDEDPDPPRIND